MWKLPFWYVVFLVVLLARGSGAVAQDGAYQPQYEQIPGPPCGTPPAWDAAAPAATCTIEDLNRWRTDIAHWRDERRARVGYESKEYRRPELKWTQSSFVQPQMMVHDRFFYDPETRQYTVERYLGDLQARYGGIDSVLIWPTYPNIGIDDRNQYDLFRDLPSGVAGVKAMVNEFHQHGVRVLFPVMMWDRGTHDEDVPDAEALSQELAAVGADGVNGDTLEGMPRSFRIASDSIGHPLALQPELVLGSDEMLAYNNMSWGYWKYDFVPAVSRNKWLETRHMVDICNRWAHDHGDDLQAAFFNGVGFEAWENIWGIWNQMTPRDAEALRRIATIERGSVDFLTSARWEPHTPMLQFGAFASKWPGDGSVLWTVINRNPYAVRGRQIEVPLEAGMRYFDLWHGVELKPECRDGRCELSFDMEANGFGAVLASHGLTEAQMQLLTTMHGLSERTLGSFSSTWVAQSQQIVPIANTAAAAVGPAGMVKAPAAEYVFRVNGIELEGTNDEGLDVELPGEDSPRRYHEMTIHTGAFWMDTFPVTNAEYLRFLNSTRYHPNDDHNFLKDWKDGKYPAGWGNKPVTWVSLEDARAYAKWAGKRLPHEWEWQYAAQGVDGRVYPWGNNWVADNVPVVDTGRKMLPSSDVGKHPKGASPFGVQDLVGNVWQWTDEYRDEHTRAAIVRGGSHYQPQGSRWYFPQAYKLSQHGKYLLMSPGLDRSGAIGFRCVRDATN